MRTNIDIDDSLLEKAMQAGPYKTKKDAVEAGLRLLARQAAYREIVKWRGKLRWEGDESIDWTRPGPEQRDVALPLTLGEPPLPAYGRPNVPVRTPADEAVSPSLSAKARPTRPAPAKRGAPSKAGRAGR